MTQPLSVTSLQFIIRDFCALLAIKRVELINNGDIMSVSFRVLSPKWVNRFRLIWYWRLVAVTKFTQPHEMSIYFRLLEDSAAGCCVCVVKRLHLLVHCACNKMPSALLREVTQLRALEGPQFCQRNAPWLPTVFPISVNIVIIPVTNFRELLTHSEKCSVVLHLIWFDCTCVFAGSFFLSEMLM
jgi:hypothetical protein